MDWVTLKNDELGTTQDFADQPGVLEHMQARGWRELDDDERDELARAEELPYVPPNPQEPLDAEDAAWVTLVHPESGGVQRVPNNASAVAAAFDLGWQYPEPAAERVEELAQEIRASSGKRRGRPTKAERAEAEEVAAIEAAATDEAPADLDPSEYTAGDGTESKE